MARLAFVLLLGGCSSLFGLDHVGEPNAEPPSVVAFASDSCGLCQAQSVTIGTVEARSRSLLLVHVVSTLAGPGNVPPSVSVTYGDRVMTLVNRATISSGTSMPILELWMLEDPEVGNHVVDVSIAGPAAAVLVGATQIEGVGDDPVRAFKSQSGEGQRAANTIASSELDLVFDAVCTGDSIEAPGLEQTLVWTELRGNVASCGNLATSIHTGAATVQLQWNVNVNQPDWWLDLAASIAPAD